MPIPKRQSIATESAELEWIVTDDGSRTLHSLTLGETYHSGCGARSECWHVYLVNSLVLDRLCNSAPTSVLEYGFGTGLAFLLTAAAAEALECDLNYVAIENNLISPNILRDTLTVKACCITPEDSSTHFSEINVCMTRIARELVLQISELPSRGAKSSTLHRLKIGSHVTLDLWLGDALVFNNNHDLQADQTDRPETRKYDAVYFDPFSPATNPQLWTPRVYSHVFQLLRGGGVLSSYCVKGQVRRELEAIGFSVERLPGPPGGKREVLRATKPR